MAGRLEGKVALITGGASGIGQATALVFAREGAKVVVADVSGDGAERTVRTIREMGGEAISVVADVSKAVEVDAMVRRTVESYGRLDCAFNNAGIEGLVSPTAECTEDNWLRVIAINLTGVWLCMKYEIAQMLKQGGGSIVNTSSGAGLVGLAGAPAYCAAKHGVAGLTKTAALEYATSGIRVNAVCPGFIRTPMVERVLDKGVYAETDAINWQPMGRMGRPEEIAEAVAWLCSDAASFVTGLPMPVDGGGVAR